jgi:Tfp pilus assembly protein PilO
MKNVGVVMNHEEKIRELEEKERALTVQAIEGARAGAVSPTLQQELAEVRAELKRLRRIVTMKANRTEPVKDVGLRVNVAAEEYRRLSDNAAAAAMTLNNYIRHLLKYHG